MISGAEYVDTSGNFDYSLLYQPLPHQEALHCSAAPYRLAVGGNGSGKSLFLLHEAVMNYCLRFPGCNVLLLRKNLQEHEKGLILDLQTIIPRELFKYNQNTHIATFYNGSKVFFGHCQTGKEKDLSQYLTAEFAFIGIDELGQFSYDAWSWLGLRNRVNKACRPDADGLMPVATMAGATNPMGQGWGWIKTTFIDRRPVPQLGELKYGVQDGKGMWFANDGSGWKTVYDPSKFFYTHSTVIDNPFMLEKDPDYINKLMAKPPAQRQKALYGDLNTLSGQYYSNFAFERHVVDLSVDPERIQFQSWQVRWIGIDWGLAHHTAVYWATRAMVRGFDGKYRPKVVVYRELVVNETGHVKLARMIADATPAAERPSLKFVFLSHEQFSRRGSVNAAHTVGAEIGEALAAQGLPRATKAAGSASKQERKDGAVFIYNLLESGELVITQDAPGKLENCENLIRAIPLLMRDDSQDGANLEDVQKTNTLEDDCFDAAKHTLLSMLAGQAKPWAVKFQEKLSKIQDPVARHFFALKEQARHEDEELVFAPPKQDIWEGRMDTDYE